MSKHLWRQRRVTCVFLVALCAVLLLAVGGPKQVSSSRLCIIFCTASFLAMSSLEGANPFECRSYCDRDVLVLMCCDWSCIVVYSCLGLEGRQGHDDSGGVC